MEKHIENWKDLRFGMFIHWGLYAIMGRGEWAMWTEAIDVDEYRKLADEFTAEKFDARAWAKNRQGYWHEIHGADHPPSRWLLPVGQSCQLETV